MLFKVKVGTWGIIIDDENITMKNDSGVLYRAEVDSSGWIEQEVPEYWKSSVYSNNEELKNKGLLWFKYQEAVKRDGSD